MWRGTLDDLATDRAEVNGDGPAAIVVGEVAGFDLLAATAAGEAAERERKRS